MANSEEFADSGGYASESVGSDFVVGPVGAFAYWAVDLDDWAVAGPYPSYDWR